MINVGRRMLAHLKDVTGTGSSRGFRQWSQLSVLIWSRSAVNNFPKSLSKAVTEESVKNRIDAAVGVRQNMTRYLHHYRRWCQWVHVQRFCHQDHLFQRTRERKNIIMIFERIDCYSKSSQYRQNKVVSLFQIEHARNKRVKPFAKIRRKICLTVGIAGQLFFAKAKSNSNDSSFR